MPQCLDIFTLRSLFLEFNIPITSIYFLFRFFSIHLKIHLPEIHQRNTHVKTKYIHMFHPKVNNLYKIKTMRNLNNVFAKTFKIVHHDHQSVQYHSRRDPDNKELRISESEYQRWKEMQLAKAHHQQLQELQQQQQQILQQQQMQQFYAKEHLNHNYHNNDNEDEDDYEDNHYKIGPTHEEYYKPEPSRKVSKKSKSDKRKSPNAERLTSTPKQEFAEYEKPFKPSQFVGARPEIRAKPKKQQLKNYGFVKPDYEDAEATANRPQYIPFAMNPSAVVTNSDPGYYKTLPSDHDIRNIEDNQDDIYSGLISNRYNSNVKDKSDTLSIINNNRKKQTKNNNKTRSN